jgi:hypothetical protein
VEFQVEVTVAIGRATMVGATSFFGGGAGDPVSRENWKLYRTHGHVVRRPCDQVRSEGGVSESQTQARQLELGRERRPEADKETVVAKDPVLEHGAGRAAQCGSGPN